ncbi:MAG: copper homeostasis periplasmic binding protein CopC, partial [Alicyclobacillaceae bacterium]|nr:copper homeostasis periplasmic binding protein CopC [Alicyclobacillaceae bacterium]
MGTRSGKWAWKEPAEVTSGGMWTMRSRNRLCAGRWPRGSWEVRIRLGRTLLGLALIFLFGCLVPSVASAHAYLVRANPVPNSAVESGPERIQLWFSEPIDPRFAHVTVFGPDGKILVSGSPAADPRDGTSLVVPLPGKLDSGTYTVHWRVVSADGHPVAGSFTFSVGTSSAARAPGSEVAQGPSLLAVAARGFQWVALLILPGLIGF